MTPSRWNSRPGAYARRVGTIMNSGAFLSSQAGVLISTRGWQFTTKAAEHHGYERNFQPGRRAVVKPSASAVTKVRSSFGANCFQAIGHQSKAVVIISGDRGIYARARCDRNECRSIRAILGVELLAGRATSPNVKWRYHRLTLAARSGLTAVAGNVFV